MFYSLSLFFTIFVVSNSNLTNIDTDLYNFPRSNLDNLDRKKNYHGLTATDKGHQAFFIQRGGDPFSIQILFVNGVDYIQWRISFGEEWSKYPWRELS